MVDNIEKLDAGRKDNKPTAWTAWTGKSTKNTHPLIYSQQMANTVVFTSPVAETEKNCN
jgi:hypothetical protein